MNWKKVKLGEYIKVKTGRLDANAQVDNGKYPFFTCSKDALQIDSFSYDCECVLIAGNGDLNVKYYKGKFDAYQRTYIIESKDMNILNLRYLYNFMSKYVEKLRFDSIGGVIKYIKIGNITDIQIPLPDLITQQHIAKVLDQADALRQQNRQLLANYDELLQSTFIDLFGDPVKNEKGWEVKKLGEVSDARLGKMLDSKKQTGLSKFKYLGNSNVLWGKFKFNDLMEMDFTQKERIELSLKKGDLLICEGGEVGRCAIWQEALEKCYFQKALHRVRVHLDKMIPEYLQFLMWFYAKNGGLKDYVTVATIAHLTGIKLKSLPIPIPPLPLQQQFAQIVEQIEEQKAVVKQSLAESEVLFEGFLAEYFG